MKNRGLRKPSNKFLLPAIALVAIAGVVWTQKPSPTAPDSQAASMPVGSPGQMFPKVRNAALEEFVQALESAKWDLAKDRLVKSARPEEFVVQIGHFCEKNQSYPQPIFELLQARLASENVSSREWVLAARAFSYLSFTPQQAKEVRAFIEKSAPKRMRSDLLPQSFVSTRPFPKDLSARLVKAVKGSDASAGREALYLLGLVKDEPRLNDANAELLKSFRKIQAPLQPYLAQHLLRHANPGLRKSAEFAKMTEFAQNQGGQIWHEAVAAGP